MSAAAGRKSNAARSASLAQQRWYSVAVNSNSLRRGVVIEESTRAINAPEV